MSRRAIPNTGSRRRRVVIPVAVGVLLWALLWWQGGELAPWLGIRGWNPQDAGYAGSSSCRPCHEEFFQMWASSHHGLAMQAFATADGVRAIAPQAGEIVIGEYRYRAGIAGEQGWVHETGASGGAKHRIEYLMGGKNVYYFLTRLERGRLQTLPIAYDVVRREWFDTPGSALRHFNGAQDASVDWREPLYTFNTSCYSCHVSQLSTHYDPKTDTYRTTWLEPGINCETCHGPGEEHNAVARKAAKGAPPEDLKIVRVGKDLDIDRQNDLCASCHAKMIPIAARFEPGDRYFDRFDLLGLEHADFYPDGRDLGENYSYTAWRLNPCARSGRLSCIHCHTSSGRFRFKEDPDKSCMPCHSGRIANAETHTRHAAGTVGSRCVSCHMPMTEFARMRRSDHSFLPPTPAASIVHGSPNACNLCHADRDAAWADNRVREWRARDYQAPVLHRAALIAAARKGDWSRLPEMLEYITVGGEEIFVSSLSRLLRECPDSRKMDALYRTMDHTAPLVRASAIEALSGQADDETIRRLIAACSDEYRLVRIRAAFALAGIPLNLPDEKAKRNLEHAMAEFETAMIARPDDYASRYNLGLYAMKRGETAKAIAEYEAALKLRPDFVPALVNSSLAYNRAGDNRKAELRLRRATQVAPSNAGAHLNLGLLLGELERYDDAETAFRKAFEHDPESALAAYNLGVLLAGKRPAESIRWCRRAFELRPNGKHGYTLAFYLKRGGESAGAAAVLEEAIQRDPSCADCYLLLADIYRQQGKSAKAEEVLKGFSRMGRR